MTKQDILNYVINTPYNTNYTVLQGMLDRLSSTEDNTLEKIVIYGTFDELTDCIVFTPETYPQIDFPFYILEGSGYRGVICSNAAILNQNFYRVTHDETGEIVLTLVEGSTPSEEAPLNTVIYYWPYRTMWEWSSDDYLYYSEDNNLKVQRLKSRMDYITSVSIENTDTNKESVKVISVKIENETYTWENFCNAFNNNEFLETSQIVLCGYPLGSGGFELMPDLCFYGMKKDTGESHFV